MGQGVVMGVSGSNPYKSLWMRESVDTEDDLKAGHCFDPDREKHLAMMGLVDPIQRVPRQVVFSVYSS